MKYLQKITLKVSELNKYKYIQAKQSDNLSRFVNIKIVDEENKQLIPSEGDTAVFRAIKPDKKSVLNPAVIEKDGTVTVELTAQVLAVKGQVEADVSIVHDKQVLSTVSFYIVVDRVPTSKDQTASSNEFLYLQELVDSAKKSADEAKEAALSIKNIPNGGKAGEVLTKKTDNDYEYEWKKLQQGEIPDISNLATKEELIQGLSTKVDMILFSELSDTVELNVLEIADLATKKADKTQLEGLATEQFVRDEINKLQPVVDALNTVIGGEVL